MEIDTSPGSGCPQLHRPTAAGLKRRSSDSTRSTSASRHAQSLGSPLRELDEEIPDRDTEPLARAQQDGTAANRAKNAKDEERHATRKPLDLMRAMVRAWSRPDAGRVVLDPFLGSGTTAEACIREGVNFVGIELRRDQTAKSTFQRLERAAGERE